MLDELQEHVKSIDMVNGFLQPRNVMLIPYTRGSWLSMTELRTLIYLAMQDGPEHHIVFWRHLSSMSGNLFLIMKQKSLVEQKYMTGTYMAWRSSTLMKV